MGLCVARSPELAVGMMAVLKAGAAFVPLDPDHPRDRLTYALEDAGANVVLAGGDGAAAVEGSGRVVLRLDGDGEAADEMHSAARAPVA